MANTKKYLSHLLQNTGITPACSEEERAAADVIAKIFTDHGFTPEVQEFSASGTAKVVQAALGIAVFIGAVLMGIGGPVGVVGMLLADVYKRQDMPTVEQIVDVVGPQSFVKPVVNGSSYGISLVKDPSELAAAIELAFEHGEKVMVERRVFGVECSVAAVGDGDTLRALPVVEILMPGQSEFYDLEVKYADPTDIHRIPADLPEDVYAQVQDIACRAHEALGLYGISRTDVIVTEDGPVILETNNVPGMTPESLVPDEARHAGIAFCDLCAELVDLALERAGR